MADYPFGNYSYSNPYDPPVSSTSIGERIIDRALDSADAIIRARYGQQAAIPDAQSSVLSPYAFVGPVNPYGTSDNSMLILAVVAVLVLVFLSRR